MAQNLLFMIEPLVSEDNGVKSYHLGFTFQTDGYKFQQLVPYIGLEETEKMAEEFVKMFRSAADQLYRDKLGLVITSTLPEGNH